MGDGSPRTAALKSRTQGSWTACTARAFGNLMGSAASTSTRAFGTDPGPVRGLNDSCSGFSNSYQFQAGSSSTHALHSLQSSISGFVGPEVAKNRSSTGSLSMQPRKFPTPAPLILPKWQSQPNPKLLQRPSQSITLDSRMFFDNNDGSQAGDGKSFARVREKFIPNV